MMKNYRVNNNELLKVALNEAKEICDEDENVKILVLMD